MADWRKTSVFKNAGALYRRHKRGMLSGKAARKALAKGLEGGKLGRIFGVRLILD